jgi:hypothetical protein
LNGALQAGLGALLDDAQQAGLGTLLNGALKTGLSALLDGALKSGLGALVSLGGDDTGHFDNEVGLVGGVVKECLSLKL